MIKFNLDIRKGKLFFYILHIYVLKNFIMILDLLNAVDNYREVETAVTGDARNLFEETSSERLNIIHINIRSIKKNFVEFLLYLELLNLKNIDVIVLSETWKIEQVSDFSIKGYNMFYNKSLFNKNDGCAIYIKDTLSVEVQQVDFSETKLLKCSFIIKNIKIGISALYRPPSTNLNLFLKDLDNYLSNTQLGNLEILIGDLNINLLNKFDAEVNDYLNILAKKGFNSLVNKATRKNNLSESIIDHIFIKNHLSDDIISGIKPSVLETSLTDHYIISLSINFNFHKQNLKEVKYIDKIDYQNLCQMVQNETWNDIYEIRDVNIAYNKFITKLHSYIKNSTNKIKINNKTKKIKPWITMGILNSLRQRDKMKKKLSHNFTDALSTQYKKYRNKLNDLIKKTKNDYYNSKIKEANHNYKQVWNLINEATNTAQKHNLNKHITLIDAHGNGITDDREKANLFNDFFINIGKKLNDSIPTSNKNHEPPVNNKNICQSLFLKPVTGNEIVQIIATLKKNSSSGEDGISAILIKKLHIFLIEPLKYLINLCFSTCQIPENWKISIVTPIYKAGNKQEKTNYRPISVINNFAKIFEKCLKYRLINFFEKHNIINKEQFGFRKSKSTEDAVFALTNNIINNMDSNKKCLAVFLDLAKAFDTVCHQKLLVKLEAAGIRGETLKLFEDYLKNRKQKVKINENMSDFQVITTGVPQGTVLGPILFLIYINDLLNSNSRGSIISYADDTAIVFTANSWEQVYEKAEKGLSVVQRWLDFNLLTLNANKTKFLTFSISRAQQPVKNILQIHHLTCNRNENCTCVIIHKEKTIKYLGVIIDQHLRWSEHANFTTAKLRKMFHKFYQLREFLSIKMLTILYKALVESVLRYCIIIWGGLYENALHSLKVCQNTILKIIFAKDNRYSTEKLFTETKLLNIRGLYIHSCLNYINKIPDLLSVLHIYQTRAISNESLQTPLYLRSHTQRNVTYFTPKFFNLLPATVIKFKNTKLFKHKTKSFILSNFKKFQVLF